MAEVLMIKCDNPKCESVGYPEHVPGQYGQRKKRGEKVVGPYGWHQGDGWCVGSGPNYSYMACSNECVGPAIIAVGQRAMDAEMEGG